MSRYPDFTVAKPALPATGTLVALVADDMELPEVLVPHQDLIDRAAKARDFNGKSGKSLDIVTPAGLGVDRLLILGCGEVSALGERECAKLGGRIQAAVNGDRKVAILAEVAGEALDASRVADIALGMMLRAYRFDRYKTKASEKDEKKQDKPAKITLMASSATAVKAELADRTAIADGVFLARDLVNEPANTLGPVEFADEAKALEQLGVKVTILTEKDMKKLGMGALLGVAQGSVRPARLAIMEWMGGNKGTKPLAFIGKGVVFDTGGISIKPAAGMEDMKGDMGGAAAVIGLMKTLATRKARANVVGAIGLVENMPSGNAQRPGDIVTSMSGQTIEVLNTDAEGRLVLADVLTHINKAYEPVFMVNLATLTGAIMIALGQAHAGLFSNDDDLAQRLGAAGMETDEKVWRMPLGSEYDKLIDSKIADMKNIGGRFGGAITAAQFLQRFVGKTPWAHLDIAGTAMGSPATDINQSWGSGFGVRLLDRLVRDGYER